MTRKIWITSEPMPASAETIAAAQAAGAGEIISRPLPAGLGTLADGYNELGGPETAPVPATISAPQARVALHRAGLLPSVNAMVDAPETDQEIKIFWEYEPTINRDSPAINAMATALGLTQAQLDDLFRTAAAIGV